MSATLPITVGVPQTVTDGNLYPIVRGDGRIVFVLESPEGMAKVGLPRRGGIDYGDAVPIKDAISVAKAALRGMV